MKINDPRLIAAAREYLVKRVGISGANTQFFVYLLEGEDFAEFRKLLEKGEEEKADSLKVITIYMKKEALLREKTVLLADLLGLSDYEDRACFISETMSQRERFLPLERVKKEQLQEYLEKVKAGMDVEQAKRELGLNPNISEFETIHESFDCDD